jgi:hypothetical protein
MSTYNCKELPKKQEDVARGKELKKEDSGSGKSSTESVNSGSGPDYKICIMLGWTPW